MYSTHLRVYLRVYITHLRVYLRERSHLQTVLMRGGELNVEIYHRFGKNITVLARMFPFYGPCVGVQDPDNSEKQRDSAGITGINDRLGALTGAIP